ncbi:hypothetical protein [Pantoea stewartii]|uniref:hypothetical protein n=1 Tax=Pantoea stewartii TaxID=66269 RepID=UPI001962B8BC|nr:hypothetical protein [Pantoea stewartii]
MIEQTQRNQMVTESVSALACAASLSRNVDHDIQGRKTVYTLSGGNIDLSRVSGLADA